MEENFITKKVNEVRNLADEELDKLIESKPIIAKKHALAQIFRVSKIQSTLLPNLNKIKLYCIILQGRYKGKIFKDIIDLDKESKTFFKYKNLRSCLFAPYKDDEDFTIDQIMQALDHRVIEVNLSKFEYCYQRPYSMQSVNYVISAYQKNYDVFYDNVVLRKKNSST